MENKFTRFSVTLIFLLFALISYTCAFRLIDTTVWWIPLSVFILIKVAEYFQDLSSRIWVGRNKENDSDKV